MVPVANDAAVRQDERGFVADGFVQQFVEIAKQIQPPCEDRRSGAPSAVRAPPQSTGRRVDRARNEVSSRGTRRTDGDLSEQTFEVEDAFERCSRLFEQDGGRRQALPRHRAAIRFRAASIDGRTIQLRSSRAPMPVRVRLMTPSRVSFESPAGGFEQFQIADRRGIQHQIVRPIPE